MQSKSLPKANRRPFYFRDVSNQELADQLEFDYPIKLKSSDIVDRIYVRYPLLPKYEIALIVMACFNVWRARLVLGDLINIRGFLHQMFLRFQRQPVFRDMKPMREWIRPLKRGESRIRAILSVFTPKKYQ
jgi:hypothetical protein